MNYAQRIRSLALSPAPAFVLTIRRVTFPCASLEEVSETYCSMRDETGEGGSTFPDGKVTAADGKKFRVSYNGRVWAGTKYVPGAFPVLG